MRKPKMGISEQAAVSFEKMADDLQSVADSKEYKRDLPARAAIMREVSHYLACAARLRGAALVPLSLKGQRQDRRERERAYFAERRTRAHVRL